MNEYIAKPINEKDLHRLILQFAGIADAHGNKFEDNTKNNNEHPATYQFINLQYMRDISSGDKEYEKTVTEQFIEAIPLDLEAPESAFTHRDIDKLRQTAHTMKNKCFGNGPFGKAATLS